MVKKWLRSGLRAMGLEIQSIRDQSVYWQYQLTPVERDDFEQLIATLGKVGKASEHGWYQPKVLRGYLTPRRIGSLKIIIDCCRKYGVDFNGKDVADVGAGTGYLFRLLQLVSNPASMTGYETAADVAKFASVACSDATFHTADVFSGEVDEKFDIVFSTEVLEHLVRPDIALLKLLGLLRPGGALAVTVPNGRSDQMPSRTKLPHAEAYAGHINFWSPESWAVFVETNCENCEVHIELLPSGNNFALVKPHA